jgi:hypothetical protein
MKKLLIIFGIFICLSLAGIDIITKDYVKVNQAIILKGNYLTYATTGDTIATIEEVRILLELLDSAYSDTSGFALKADTANVGYDPHITDSTIYIEDQSSGNYVDISISDQEDGYFDIYSMGDDGNFVSLYTFTSEFYYAGNYNGNNGFISFDLPSGIFSVSYEDTAIIDADTTGLYYRATIDTGQFTDYHLVNKGYLNSKIAEIVETDPVYASDSNYILTKIDTIYNQKLDTGTTPETVIGYDNKLIQFETIDVSEDFATDTVTVGNVEITADKIIGLDLIEFNAQDTTVTAVVGRIVFKSSDTHFYGCRQLTGKKWYQLDN